MNKRNFVYNYTPLKDDFDALQNDMERGIKDVASAVAGMGILSGLTVSISGSDATISPGIAYDGQGNRMALSDPLVISIGGITRPSAGQYKWITIVLRYEITEQGQVIDGNNVTWPARLLDSCSALLLEGTEGTAGTVTKPPYLDWQVPLADIRVDHSSPWENLVIETNRRRPLASVSKLNTKIQNTGHLPVGLVWMFDGDNWEDNVTLPGWYACTTENAARGCPNLVDRFVMGRSLTGSGGTGGSNTLILTTANLPSHTHGIDHDHGSLTTHHNIAKHRHTISHDHPSIASGAGGGHNYANKYLQQVKTRFTSGNSSGSNTTISIPFNGSFSSAELYTGSNEGHDISIHFKGQTDTNNIPQHSHAVDIPNITSQSTEANCSHAHVVDVPSYQGSSGPTGNGSPIDKRPAYYSVIFIKKVA